MLCCDHCLYYRCHPHTVNIAVQHVISSFEDARCIAEAGAAAQQNPPPGASVGIQESYLAAGISRPFSRQRALIQAMRVSSLRRHNFSAFIAHGNTMKMWRNPQDPTDTAPYTFSQLGLILDVPACWDSTYLMLDHTQTLRQVSTLFALYICTDMNPAT